MSTRAGAGRRGRSGRLRRWTPSRPATLALDVAAWAVVHASTGYLAHRLPARRIAGDGWLLAPRRFEGSGEWYRRRLRIHAWKDRLPEAGALFDGGVSKRALPGRDRAGIELFVRETRRAELAHWWAMLPGPVFALWNPPAAAAVHVGYGVAVNLPFVAIQRYNRVRAVGVLRRLDPSSAGARGGRLS